MPRNTKKLSGGANPKLISEEQERRLREGRVRRGEQLANITQRQNNAKLRRAQKKALRQAGVNEYKASIRDLQLGEKTTRLGAYREYCENLQRSYDMKHKEVGTATEMIASIKSKLEGITVDVLKNLKRMEDISNDNVRLNVDGSEGEDPYTFDDMARLLGELFALIPTTPDVEERRRKLDQAINMQNQWTKQRTDNDKVITDKIAEITGQIENLKVLSGSGEAGGAAAPRRNAARNNNRSGTAGRRSKKTKKANKLQRELNNARRR